VGFIEREPTIAVRVRPGRLVVGFDDATGTDQTWGPGDVMPDLLLAEARELLSRHDVEEV
jgi:hypothetical protein